MPKLFSLLKKKAHSSINKLHLAPHVYLLFIHSEIHCGSHHPGKIPEGIAQRKQDDEEKGEWDDPFCVFPGAWCAGGAIMSKTQSCLKRPVTLGVTLSLTDKLNLSAVSMDSTTLRAKGDRVGGSTDKLIWPLHLLAIPNSPEHFAQSSNDISDWQLSAYKIMRNMSILLSLDINLFGCHIKLVVIVISFFYSGFTKPHYCRQNCLVKRLHP